MASKKKNRANNHKNKKRKSTAGVRGVLRDEHFKGGGTLAGWRGTSAVHKKRSEKRNSRAIAKRKAISESQED